MTVAQELWFFIPTYDA